MGFNKRYIDKEKILNAIKTGFGISNLTNADALIIDNWGSIFLKNYDFTQTYKENRHRLNNDVKLSSNLYDTRNHRNFSKLRNLSNILENLMTDPTWTEIELTLDILGNDDVTDNIKGKFNELKNLCIDKIINYYTLESRNKLINQIID